MLIKDGKDLNNSSHDERNVVCCILENDEMDEHMLIIHLLEYRSFQEFT